jgi:energy-coupling factor transport system ATP-binding protein
MIAFTDVRCQIISIDRLAIPPGIISVIGPNGSGKSTLLKLCAGILEPENGCVLVDGKGPRACEVGYVGEFPNRNILFSTVSDELASPLRFCHMPCSETRRTVRECAERVGISHILNRMIRDLSGGEKVLVSLAAACIAHPRVLILDECDSHLDSKRCSRMETIVRTAGAAYVIRCTQQMETAACGDHLIFVCKGKVTHEGNPASVFASLAGSPFYPLSWRCRL